jgi:NitT/TauT family transport system substrate-binding protein
MARFLGFTGLAAMAALAISTLATPAAAETQTVRVARQLGLGYLQLYVAEKERLIEKHAAAAGLGEVKVSWIAIGNPSAIGDAILSNSAEFGASGVPPFLLLWDRTRGADQIKALAALNSQPAYLNTNKPNVKSIADFAPEDRIAVPSVKTAFQAIILQMAAEKTFGEAQRFKLDTQTVSLSHPDATVAILGGRSEIVAHFTSPPYQYQQLRDPKVHRVLSSYEITDGPASFSALYAKSSFEQKNPKLTRAVLDAIEEATSFIRTRPDDAARIFIEIEKSNLTSEFVRGMLADPEIRYGVAPEKITVFTDFLARTGLIKAKPADWRELFFPELHDRAGS